MQERGQRQGHRREGPPCRTGAVLAVSVCATLSAAVAPALELGDAVVTSRLDSPLVAVIRVADATPAELDQLRADIPQPEVFRRYGLDRPDFLTGATVGVRRASDGSTVLELRSRRAVSEPFVTVLLAVEWGNGRTLREFNLAVERPGYSAEALSPVELPRASAAAGVAEVVVVGRGDTLQRIARKVSRRLGVGLSQTMVAIYRTNPAAFGATMNDLRAGAELLIPDAATIVGMSKEIADQEVAGSIVDWRRRSGVAVASDASMPGRVRLVAASGVALGGSEAVLRPVRIEGPESAGAAVADPAAARIAELESQLLAERRRLELSQNELARLQERAAQQVAVASTQPRSSGAFAWLFAAALVAVAVLVRSLSSTRRLMRRAQLETESLNRALAAAVASRMAVARPERRGALEATSSREPALAVGTVPQSTPDISQRTPSL